MTTPADELKTAVTLLRSGFFIGVRYSTSPVAALLRARSPLANWLESTADLHEPHLCDKHEGCEAIGCQWCGDEDWPCADMRNALAVARAINGGQP
jgi:hypothetical protein